MILLILQNLISSIDVLIMENHNDNGTDVIFNFSAGLNGDKIDFSKPYVPTTIFGAFQIVQN